MEGIGKAILRDFIALCKRRDDLAGAIVIRLHFHQTIKTVHRDGVEIGCALRIYNIRIIIYKFQKGRGINIAFSERLLRFFCGITHLRLFCTCAASATGNHDTDHAPKSQEAAKTSSPT